jgi:hypothetical protein
MHIRRAGEGDEMSAKIATKRNLIWMRGLAKNPSSLDQHSQISEPRALPAISRAMNFQERSIEANAAGLDDRAFQAVRHS